MTMNEIFRQLFSNSWPSDAELVEYAVKRHGYGGDDGYYGVTYPTDLNEYEIVVERRCIKDGNVEIAYWDGDFQAVQVSEAANLEALEANLQSKGHAALAGTLRSLLTALRSNATPAQ
jgi:hypothetical protein